MGVRALKWLIFTDEGADGVLLCHSASTSVFSLAKVGHRGRSLIGPLEMIYPVLGVKATGPATHTKAGQNRRSQYSYLHLYWLVNTKLF